MTDVRRCPQCAAEIPANAPDELCPACLLRAGIGSEAASVAIPSPLTEASPPASGGFVPPAPEELAARLPQFEVLELLGRGGMGAVYKCRQKHLDRLVAVKILAPEISHDPAFAERFAREARALARLNHPHIVGIYDFGHTESLYYLVMEYVDGLNLRHLLATDPSKSPANALAIVPQICEALQYAHDEGIVHRDIKPENILIDKKGRVKIADFGLAKLMASGGRESPDSLTGTHQVMGTMRYMAPEQMEGSKQVDHRADIYSLGVVFYELLTGELPLGRFAPPSKKVAIDVRLDEVVLRALEKAPEQRWQQANQVKTEVETISRTPTPRNVPPAAPASPPAPRSLSWKKLLIGWAGVVLLLAIVAALIPDAKITNYRKHSIFIPQSGAYSRLLLGGDFQSVERGGIVTNVRPSRWTMEIETTELDPNIKRSRKLEFPTPPQTAYDGYFMPGPDPYKVEDAKVSAEVQKVRFFVENYFSTPENLPSSWDEFHQRAVQGLQPNFSAGGFEMAYHGVEEVKTFWPVFGWGSTLTTWLVGLLMLRSLGRWPVVAWLFASSVAAAAWYSSQPQFQPSSAAPHRIVWSMLALWAFVVLNYSLTLWAAAGSIRQWVETPADASARLQRRVRGPAIAMIIVGSLGIIACLVMTAAFIVDGRPPLWAGGLLALVSRLVTVFAGVQLADMRGRGWGITSSILLLLPTDPLAVVAIPIGIWGLSTLLRDDIARALAAPRVDAAAQAWFKKAASTTGWGIACCVFLIVIVTPYFLQHVYIQHAELLEWAMPTMVAAFGILFLTLVATSAIKPVPLWQPLVLIAAGAIVIFAMRLCRFTIVPVTAHPYGLLQAVPAISICLGVLLILLGGIQLRGVVVHAVSQRSRKEAPPEREVHQPATFDKSAAPSSETKEQGTGKVIALFCADLVLVLVVLGLVWATVGWAEATVWASLTWLFSHGLLYLWLQTTDQTARRFTRATLLTSWTLACSAVYFTLWMADAPHTSWWARGLGYLDRFYWPYEGKSLCSVTLIPTDKTFRQLTITNDREMRRDGYGSLGVVNWSGPGWGGERTKDLFTVQFLRNDGAQSQPLVFQGIGKREWSYTEFGTGKRFEGTTPLTVDGAIAWLERNGVEAQDRKALERQTKAWIDLLYVAASQDDASGGYRGSHYCVGYLDFFVGREQLAMELKAGGPEQILQPGPFQFPWIDHLGTHECTFAPVVPILYVGVPVMLAVWLLGLLPLVRSGEQRRAAVSKEDLKATPFSRA